MSALAEAAYRADGENLRRIKAAWPEYWAQYQCWAMSERAVVKAAEAAGKENK